MSTSFRSLLPALCVAAGAWLLPTHGALAATYPIWNMVTNSIGAVSAFNDADGSAFGAYHLLGDEAVRLQTWTFAAVAPTTARYAYAWDYNGYHSLDAVYFLAAFGGSAGPPTSLYALPTNTCCASPGDLFSRRGVYDFGVVQAGQSFGFYMGGNNLDTERLLQGTLDVTAVPEPSTWAMAGLGLAMLGWHGRKLRRRAGVQPQA